MEEYAAVIMMSKLSPITFLVAALLIIGLSADATGTKIVDQFSDAPPILTSNNPLFDLHTIVEADKVQSQKVGGINLTVTTTNTGDQAIALTNPLDFLSVFLRDKNGWPIELPPSYSRFLIDGTKEADSDRFRLSFEVKQVTLNNHKFTPQEVEQHFFLLPPRALLQIALCIDKVVTSTRQVPVSGTTSTEPIVTLGTTPSGEYQVHLLVMFSLPTNPVINRMFETGIMHIELK